MTFGRSFRISLRNLGIVGMLSAGIPSRRYVNEVRACQFAKNATHKIVGARVSENGGRERRVFLALSARQSEE